MLIGALTRGVYISQFTLDKNITGIETVKFSLFDYFCVDGDINCMKVPTFNKIQSGEIGKRDVKDELNSMEVLRKILEAFVKFGRNLVYPILAATVIDIMTLILLIINLKVQNINVLFYSVIHILILTSIILNIGFILSISKLLIIFDVVSLRSFPSIIDYQTGPALMLSASSLNCLIIVLKITRAHSFGNEKGMQEEKEKEPNVDTC
ncbi:12930_t:CDS:2 [Funneliformis geosporum]|uniref:4469_t:CDS:1 n=1 Tax=Funneliformis geosporum TaxID=1117311 RepID=A0A9W4SGB5_9GLOM|nr:12930_t:CDS:2 [Funneliformis geosporum]CAI2168519.1 4469_t:CDS:2 [Funneliformis geosporum]